MTRHIILTLMLGTVLSLQVYSQKTKEIVKKFPKSKQIKEKYSVLKSDKTIMHGDYISYHQERYGITGESLISISGRYFKGKKNGVWVTYDPPVKKRGQTQCCYVKSEEVYKMGRKAGIWKSHIEDGKVILRHDYDKDKDLEPLYNVYAEYPIKALETNLMGIVKISYILNKDCSISDLVVSEGLETECDKAALESIKEQRRLVKKYSLLKECEPGKKSNEVKFELR